MRHTPRNLSLYLVTDTVMCGQFGVAATVSAAVAAGVKVVQLRDEHATDDELVSLGRKILGVLEGTGVPLIVNDRVHLVDAMGAHGGHVGQSDLGIDPARALLGPVAYLGLSVQTMEHLAAARRHAAADVELPRRRTGVGDGDQARQRPGGPEALRPDHFGEPLALRGHRRHHRPARAPGPPGRGRRCGSGQRHLRPAGRGGGHPRAARRWDGASG